MEEITLALAILLSVGFAAAKLAQFLHLPSVTGFILAGLLLGPSGFGMVTQETIGAQLEHFTQIALMLIAFGIGEHLEIQKLRYTVKNVVYVAAAEITGAFFLVSLGTFCVLVFFPTKNHLLGLGAKEIALIAFLLGPVAVHPTHQGEGLGGLLIEESMARAKELGWTRVILVGDAPYYGRFGFAKADFLTFPPPTNPDRLLYHALEEGAFDGVSGMIGKADQS